MPQFDETGDLELFLRRFQTLAKYYGWNGGEKLFKLSNCIQGEAQYVLLNLDHLDIVDELINCVKSRFASAAHAERYLTELSQLRRGALSLEQLHLKV